MTTDRWMPRAPHRYRSFWLADVVERDEAGAPTRVRVLEPADGAEGQWIRFKLAPEDDAEGHGLKYSGLRPAEDDDVEGQWARFRLAPEEDAQGHVLVIGEGTKAPEGIAGRTFVVEDDVEGQGLKYGG